MPADRVCGAAGCGKGVSDVKTSNKSQRDETKTVWFCNSCYSKEVRIPQFPQLYCTSMFHPEPFR